MLCIPEAGSSPNQVPTGWTQSQSKTPAPAQRERAPSLNTQDKKAQIVSYGVFLSCILNDIGQFGALLLSPSEWNLMIKVCFCFVWHQLHLFDSCLLRGLGTSGTPVTTGRLRPARFICSPALVPAPSELYSKENGMVGMSCRCYAPSSVSLPLVSWQKKINNKQSACIIAGHTSFVDFIIIFVAGDVAVKILKVTDPTPEQFQAFRNEVAVLRWECIKFFSYQH